MSCRTPLSPVTGNASKFGEPSKALPKLPPFWLVGGVAGFRDGSVPVQRQVKRPTTSTVLRSLGALLIRSADGPTVSLIECPVQGWQGHRLAAPSRLGSPAGCARVRMKVAFEQKTIPFGSSVQHLLDTLSPIISSPSIAGIA